VTRELTQSQTFSSRLRACRAHHDRFGLRACRAHHDRFGLRACIAHHDRFRWVNAVHSGEISNLTPNARCRGNGP